MGIIVLYQSKYGTTEQYARWLAEDLKADLSQTKEFDWAGIKDYDTVVVGGGIYAGSVQGAKELRKHKELLKGKRVAVFTSALTPPEKEEWYQQVRKQALGGLAADQTEWFHLPGAIHYDRLTFVHKKVVNMIKKMSQKGKGMSAEDAMMADALNNNSTKLDRAALNPMLQWIRSA